MLFFHLGDYFADKKINLPSSQALSVIPFFDCLYVSSPSTQFNKNFKDFITEFNELISNGFTGFLEKPIDKNVDMIRSPKELEKYLIINDWFTKPNNSKKVTSLLKILKMNSYTESVNVLDQDGYETLTKQIRTSIFSHLLKLDITTCDDINSYIKNA